MIVIMWMIIYIQYLSFFAMDVTKFNKNVAIKLSLILCYLITYPGGLVFKRTLDHTFIQHRVPNTYYLLIVLNQKGNLKNSRICMHFAPCTYVIISTEQTSGL